LKKIAKPKILPHKGLHHEVALKKAKGKAGRDEIAMCFINCRKSTQKLCRPAPAGEKKCGPQPYFE